MAARLSKKGAAVFAINEKVVYPGHGVAQVVRILEKEMAHQMVLLYELKFLAKDIIVLVPTGSVENVGIRALSNTESIDEALKVIGQPARRLQHGEFSASTWNKRNKDYQLKLRRGNMRELSEIYRDLRYIETEKELSFGEKNILQQAEHLLVEEIAAAEKVGHDRATEKLRLCYTNAKKIIKTL